MIQILLGELIGTATKEKKGLVAPDMFSFTRSATDANGCSVFGSYRLSPSTLNVPDGIKYGDVLFVVQWDTNTMHQFIYTISGGTYRRVGGKENWSGWVKDWQEKVVFPRTGGTSVGCKQWK